MQRLDLYADYSREDVHAIFSPETRFVPQAGTWGLHGIVAIPDRPGDYVFFVTFGKRQGGHKFNEWVTSDGALSWQSQPRQLLTDPKIQHFINLDDEKNSIYLFLRTSKNRHYTYLGRLQYLAHHPFLERPVYILWQILDWNVSDEVVERMGLELKPSNWKSNFGKKGTVIDIFASEESVPGYSSAEVQNVTNRKIKDQVNNNSFYWRGTTYVVDKNKISDEVNKFQDRSLPSEAKRFVTWCTEVEGQKVSYKWIFHLVTGAGYHEFDATTARHKLSRMGFAPAEVDKISTHEDLEIPDIELENLKPRKKGGVKSRRIKRSTLDVIVQLLTDLSLVGEVRNVSLSTKYNLADKHYHLILQSGLVQWNPESIVASPKFINLLPDFSQPGDKESLMEILGLTNARNWSTFLNRTFHRQNSWSFNLLGTEYLYKQKIEDFTDEQVFRPAFYFNLICPDPNNVAVVDNENWDPKMLTRLSPIFLEPKVYVHSSVPVTNLFGGEQALLTALWNNPFYWLAIQLLILSDMVIGEMYERKLNLVFSDRIIGDIYLYFGGNHVGQIYEIFDDLMSIFRWVWVNKTNHSTWQKTAIESIYQVLYILNTFDIERDGRATLSNNFRNLLLDNSSNLFYKFKQTRDGREEIRKHIMHRSYT